MKLASNSFILVTFFLFLFASKNANSGENMECLFAGSVPKDIECGELKVEEDHFSVSNNFFRLPFLLINPAQSAPELSPLLLLLGGPGESTGIDSRATVYRWREIARQLAPNRKFYVLELRGSRNSQPTFDCPENHPREIVMNVGVENQNKLELAAQECLKRLKEERKNPKSINRLQIAYDVKAFADHIMANSISLIGTSYGTTYAMTVADKFPELVEYMILDGPFPPEATNDLSNTLSLGHTLNLVFSECRQQVDCLKKYPDLENKFHDLIVELDEKPIEVEFVNRDIFAKQVARVDAELFIAILKVLMGSRDFLNEFPESIVSRDRKLLKRWISAFGESMPFDQYSFGAFLSAYCYDLPAEFSDTQSKYESSLFDEIEYGYLALSDCRDWHNERSLSADKQKLISDIPALILVSEFDPATPAYLGDMVKSGLKNSYLFKFPGGVHGLLFNNICAQEIANKFLADVNNEPSVECFRNVRKFRFRTAYRKFGENPEQ